MSKARGHNDRKLRRMVSERACIVCGTSPCDPHHYPIRRSHGGLDVPENLVPLCHPHHRLFHDGEAWVIEAVEAAAPHYFEVIGA